MKAIVISSLDELPENCVKCPLQWCNIPLCRDGVTIKKNSVKKRNPNCPLREVEIKENEK